MEKDNAALAVGEHRDLCDLTALAPGGRCGVGMFALALDRAADRFGDALVNSVGKKHWKRLRDRECEKTQDEKKRAPRS
ncbi:hypothetical protein ACLKMY_31275 [Paraburkholderia mimosarum]|uniref:hypothetical protein n=1 Tax=Paraburkholderia mimosarum TaxID=312026 RepID=UPI0012B63C20|nr:hypothetical protein [Paraburkholderia mimosarum]